jgi:threonine aldolase
MALDRWDRTERRRRKASIGPAAQLGHFGAQVLDVAAELVSVGSGFGEMLQVLPAGARAAVLGSIQPQPIENAPDGTLPLEQIAAAIKPADDDHFARSRLLALENTTNGRVLPHDYVREAVSMARKRDLSAHLDGARVFNAAVASGRPIADLCTPFDSVSICFSKGLGTPVGSVLVGGRRLIADAKRWRKVLGGGMRQSGRGMAVRPGTQCRPPG